jgi:hypothetical protein
VKNDAKILSPVQIMSAALGMVGTCKSGWGSPTIGGNLQRHGDDQISWIVPAIRVFRIYLSGRLVPCAPVRLSQFTGAFQT